MAAGRTEVFMLHTNCNVTLEIIII